jgi:hypothetical protein
MSPGRVRIRSTSLSSWSSAISGLTYPYHPERFDGDGLAVDAEQPLDDPLRLLVPSLAEVLVANHALPVDE